MAKKLNAIPRVLFVRVGWSREYRGDDPEDYPVRGGSYNDKNVGSEYANFLEWKGRVYGYFQTPIRGDVGAPVRLDRVAPDAPSGDKLKGVLLIFVATHPKGGQVVVGWYRDATLLRINQRDLSHPEDRSHRAIAAVKDAVLLPPTLRSQAIEHGIGGFGRANICYPFDRDGNSKWKRWMKDAVTFVDEYDGPNFMHDRSDEGIEDGVDAATAAALGQGFAINAAQRKVIEAHAMAKAMTFFKKKYSSVTDVHSEPRSYDIHCQNGKKELWVEVKGTTGDGSVVFLTRKEYELAKQGKSALYVLHSIQLKSGKASGGEARVLNIWDASKGDVVPVAYRYELPSKVPR